MSKHRASEERNGSLNRNLGVRHEIKTRRAVCSANYRKQEVLTKKRNTERNL